MTGFSTHMLMSCEGKPLASGGATVHTNPASTRLAHHHIPLDREHVVGHEDPPGLTPDRVAGMHDDLGPYRHWEHYFDCWVRRCRPRASRPHRC